MRVTKKEINGASSQFANPKLISKSCIVRLGVDVGPTWR